MALSGRHTARSCVSTGEADVFILYRRDCKEACSSAMTQRVGFLFLGPAAHIAHAATIAFELDGMPGYEATALVSSDINAGIVQALATRYGRGCAIERLHAGLLHRLMRRFKRRLHPRVRYVLNHNRRYLHRFDALVMTDAHLIGNDPTHRSKLVLAGHGPGPRAHGRYPDMGHFDLLLQSGRARLELMKRVGKVDEDKCRIIGYPKFDLARGGLQRQSLFGNDRPVVLYNPHFNTRESSWSRWGEQVLEYFLAHPQYNLVFAPHALLSVHLRPRLARRYLRAPNIHVDLDGPALIDMTYTTLADIYLGDASSQAYEFVGHRPRPCIFLDSHGRRWQDNPNLAMWRMGDVIQDIDGLDSALQMAGEHFKRYRVVQKRLVADTFDTGPIPAGRRGALAIIELLAGAQAHHESRYKRTLQQPETIGEPP